MKQFCASDMHIGYEYTNYDKVCKFLDLTKNKADKLILCGDTFDLWRYPVDRISIETMLDFTEVLNCLKETAKEIPVCIIPGNHDYNLSDAWKNYKHEYPVTISNSFSHNFFYYTHGWEFDIKQRMFSFVYSHLIERFPYLYQRFFKKPAQMGRPKDDDVSFLINKINLEAREFAVENHLKYVIMGHTHVPGIFDKVINCGDFIDSCSYVVIDNQDKPKLQFI